jgi:hypothetical protein
MKSADFGKRALSFGIRLKSRAVRGLLLFNRSQLKSPNRTQWGFIHSWRALIGHGIIFSSRPIDPILIIHLKKNCQISSFLII